MQHSHSNLLCFYFIRYAMKGTSRYSNCQAQQLWLVIIFCIIFFSVSGIQSRLFAQQYPFPEVKETLFIERPQSGNIWTRKAYLVNIDYLLISSLPILTEDTRLSYTSMINKAIHEIRAEKVTEGVTIWQIFNHGFVVKTPSLTFGFDLKDYYETEEFLELANLIDIYFISHEHRDHSSPELIEILKSMDKPIVGCAEWSEPSVGMSVGESMDLNGLSVTAHFGKHSVPVRQFEIVTPEGIRILHTGDNQTSETLPDIDNIDILLINSWINESGATSSIEGVRIAVNKLTPQVTLPGHIMELWHLLNGWHPVSYQDALEVDNGTFESEYHVLAWGERYHYGNSSTDITVPNPIDNVHYQQFGDSSFLSWDAPLPSSDGDTASFYRINLNGSIDFFTEKNELRYVKPDYNEQEVKVYSYDDCGNQSTGYHELITSLNENVNIDHELGLFQIYPNPADPSTTLSFHVPYSSKIIIEVIDNRGIKIRELVDRTFGSGTHNVSWDGLNNENQRIPNGIYVVRMHGADFSIARKLLVLEQ